MRGFWRWCILLAGAALACAQPAGVLPLSEVRPGMKATGKTVFAGGRTESFDVEILGVMENVGPKQSVILARLSGGPLAQTGVLQGMSGSPVYLGDRLVGAVALSFPFSKEPIAGIRPAEEMLASPSVPSPARAALDAAAVLDPSSVLAAAPSVQVGPQQLTQIATPFWLSGFTASTFEHFAPALRRAGFAPTQGLSGGGRPASSSGRPLEPGEMISVQLMTGDMSVGADGTVTHIDGDRVWAFGHRFLALGDTAMPFARAEVLTLLASNQLSFKISTPREWLGAITQDRSAAIAGRLGQRPRMLPITLRVRHGASGPLRQSYRMEMVDDRLMSPLLTQMAVFSAIEATERVAGLASISLRGDIRLAGAPPVRIENLYATELGAPQMASAALAAPLALLMQSGFDDLRIEAIDLELQVTEDRKQLQLDTVWASRREARPGETVRVHASFQGDGNREIARFADFTVPVGMPPGPLYFTVSDALTSNVSEFRQFLFTPPRTRQQLLDFLNGLRPNTKAYLRVWRPDRPSWQVQGEILPQPPPSAALILAKSQQQTSGAKVAELEMAAGDFAFAGSKTLQVMVKE